MGKYMRKSKAVMEVSPSPLGVRTRAKTLALQKLQKSSTPAPASVSSESSGSYLQLRSRRLEKPPIVVPGGEPKRQKQTQKEGSDGSLQNPKANPKARASSRLRVGSTASGSNAAVSVNEKDDRKDEGEAKEAMDKSEANRVNEDNDQVDLTVDEASFGDNVLDFEGRERSTRESTPCSLIRDPDAVRTPGSTTRPTSSTEANRRIQSSSRPYIPTTQEVDEFFARAEQKQQRQFIEKYNFDPVKDKPLPGRFEWEKVDP